MKIRLIPAFTVLTASLMTVVSCLIRGKTAKDSLIELLIVMIVFYVVGKVAAFIINRTLTPAEENDRTKQASLEKEQEEKTVGQD